MKTPLCDICRALRNVLCRECERKLNAGLLNETDIMVARALTRLEFESSVETPSRFDGIVVERAVDLGERMTVIFTPDEQSRDAFLRVKLEIEYALGKKISVVVLQKGVPLNAKASRRKLEEILNPVKMQTVRAFKDGREFEKIVITRADLKLQDIDEKLLDGLVKGFLEGLEVSFV
jgi:hypothetical protein